MIFNIYFLTVKDINIEIFYKIFNLLLFCCFQTRLALDVEISYFKCILRDPTVSCGALASYCRSVEEAEVAWEAEEEDLTCLDLNSLEMLPTYRFLEMLNLRLPSL
jgi:hypothetical protein